MVSAEPGSDRYLNEIRARTLAYFEDQAEGRDGWKRRAGYYHGRIERLLRSLIPSGRRVLELGCGTGDLLAATLPSRGLGVDFSPRMTALARKKYPALSFEVDDIENLELRETFDYVILSDAIGSLGDVWEGFRRLKQVCRPDTRVIVTNSNYLWEPLLRLAERLGLKARQPLQHWLPLSDIENLLALNGFAPVREGYAVLLPVWIPFVSDFVNRWLAPLPVLRRLCLVQYLVARPRPEGPAEREEPVVSVVVPCLDEEGNIAPLVERLPRLGRKTELIFVDGRSVDGTVKLIEEARKAPRPGFELKFVDQGGRFGKGDAVRKAFDAATGDFLIILDADLSVAPEDLPKFFLALLEGRGEMINGSRLNYPMEDQAMRYLNNVANKLFGLALSWLLDRRIRDTLCGTKALRKSDYEKIKAQRAHFGDFDPFGDFDLLFGAARLGLEIVEMPVRYRSRSYGETKISRFRHGLLLARMCLVAARKLKFD
jgi:SAM-dependent methyltransferase